MADCKLMGHGGLLGDGSWDMADFKMMAHGTWQTRR